jgi:hypothetical protein
VAFALALALAELVGAAVPPAVGLSIALILAFDRRDRLIDPPDGLGILDRQLVALLVNRLDARSSS